MLRHVSVVNACLEDFTLFAFTVTNRCIKLEFRIKTSTSLFALVCLALCGLVFFHVNVESGYVTKPHLSNQMLVAGEVESCARNCLIKKLIKLINSTIVKRRKVIS